jgi:uncharacterized RDD family membrane protein YckC
VYAGTGQRFVNYLIDLLIYNLVVRFIINPLVASGNSIIYSTVSSSVAVFLINQLFFFVLYTSYMFLQETIFKGKSIGKFVTGTRAVNEDGSSISTKTALLRSLIRIIPFEPFSAFGNPARPWHDRWTLTYVIDEKKSVLNPDAGL